MKPSEVSVVIPTRGDVDLTQVLGSLTAFDEVLVYDNSLRLDLKVFGRYAILDVARNPVVYTQDDDCIIARAAELCELYEPGVIVANMPESRWADYPDSCLVGWGSIFDRALPELAFWRWHEAGHASFDDRFTKTCDVVFTTLTKHRKVDLGFEHLPWAETPGRMFKQPDHQPMRAKTLEMARRIRDSRA